MLRTLAVTVLFLAATPCFAALSFTADADGRVLVADETEAQFYATSLSLRRVFADSGGDRLEAFLMLEAMHDFEELMLGESYLRYKGPMGSWNVRGGRFRVPYGLLPGYSTERLLVTTPELFTIGIFHDDGVELSGIKGSLEYAASYTNGEHSEDVGVARLGYRGVDFESPWGGISFFAGKVLSAGGPVKKQLFALDLTKNHGLFVFRGEVHAGKEAGATLVGAFLGTDYGLLPTIDLNLAATYVEVGEGTRSARADLGLSYNPWTGLFIRGVKQIPLKKGGQEDEVIIQAYYVISSLL